MAGGLTRSAASGPDPEALAEELAAVEKCSRELKRELRALEKGLSDRAGAASAAPATPEQRLAEMRAMRTAETAALGKLRQQISQARHTLRSKMQEEAALREATPTDGETDAAARHRAQGVAIASIVEREADTYFKELGQKRRAMHEVQEAAHGAPPAGSALRDLQLQERQLKAQVADLRANVEALDVEKAIAEEYRDALHAANDVRTLS